MVGRRPLVDGIVVPLWRSGVISRFSLRASDRPSTEHSRCLEEAVSWRHRRLRAACGFVKGLSWLDDCWRPSPAWRLSSMTSTLPAPARHFASHKTASGGNWGQVAEGVGNRRSKFVSGSPSAMIVCVRFSPRGSALIFSSDGAFVTYRMTGSISAAEWRLSPDPCT